MKYQLFHMTYVSYVYITHILIYDTHCMLQRILNTTAYEVSSRGERYISNEQLSKLLTYTCNHARACLLKQQLQ